MTSLTSATHALDQSHLGCFGETHGSTVPLDLYGIAVTEHSYHLRGEERERGRPVRSTGGGGWTVVGVAVRATDLARAHCQDKQTKYDGLKEGQSSDHSAREGGREEREGEREGGREGRGGHMLYT